MNKINEDAIFIADSHTQKGRDGLIFALNELKKNEPSQVFFLGDIANILIGNIESSQSSNRALIQAINELQSEVFYFEGNHDFNLACIFPKARVIPRKESPKIFMYNNKKVLISHGDLMVGEKYELYIKILTSNFALKVFYWLDSLSPKIYQFIEKRVQNKIIKSPKNPRLLLESRIKKYEKWLNDKKINVDFVLEGHFHFEARGAIDSCADDKIDSVDVKMDSNVALDSNQAKNAIYICLPSFCDYGKFIRARDLFD